jgi:hypothetical protein
MWLIGKHSKCLESLARNYSPSTPALAVAKAGSSKRPPPHWESVSLVPVLQVGQILAGDEVGLFKVDAAVHA